MVAVSVVAVVRVVAVVASARPRSERTELLGVPLDLLDRPAVEQRIVDALSSSRPELLHVVTLNPEYVVAAEASTAFRTALERAELSVPDGSGIVLAHRCLTGERITRITGVDLADWLLNGQFAESPRVFLLGSPASVAALQGRHPARVVGRWGAGASDASDDAESIARIQERSANAVLVGYGAPAQIFWIERNRAALAASGVRIAIGVGGALDYLAEATPRAPKFIQRLGLEWAYRLAREPWRWRRQLALPKFALLVARTRLGRQ